MFPNGAKNAPTACTPGFAINNTVFHYPPTNQILDPISLPPWESTSAFPMGQQIRKQLVHQDLPLITQCSAPPQPNAGSKFFAPLGEYSYFPNGQKTRRQLVHQDLPLITQHSTTPPPKYWIQVLAQTRRAGCFCGCAGPSGRSRAQPMGWGPPRGPCGGPDLRAPNAAASTVPPRVLQVCAAPRPVGPGPTRRTQRVASNPCPGPCKPLLP